MLPSILTWSSIGSVGRQVGPSGQRLGGWPCGLGLSLRRGAVVSSQAWAAASASQNKCRPVLLPGCPRGERRAVECAAWLLWKDGESCLGRHCPAGSISLVSACRPPCHWRSSVPAFAVAVGGLRPPPSSPALEGFCPHLACRRASVVCFIPHLSQHPHLSSISNSETQC